MGKIIEGTPCGWFFTIKDDLEETGGYLILISKDPKISKFVGGYDYWAEDKHTATEIVKSFNWKLNGYNIPCVQVNC